MNSQKLRVPPKTVSQTKRCYSAWMIFFLTKIENTIQTKTYVHIECFISTNVFLKLLPYGARICNKNNDLLHSKRMKKVFQIFTLCNSTYTYSRTSYKQKTSLLLTTHKISVCFCVIVYCDVLKHFQDTFLFQTQEMGWNTVSRIQV